MLRTVRWQPVKCIHAVDIYGLSEVMGPGVAQECVETKDGLHTWEDHFYLEVIDSISGEVLPEGEQASWSSPSGPRRRCRSCSPPPRSGQP